MKIFLTLLVNLITLTLLSQNLIPNPGFEDNYFPPERHGQWCAAKHWWNLNGDCDTFPGFGSPDYFHTEGGPEVKFPKNPFGYMEPFKGDAIMGITTYSSVLYNFREYLFTKLKEPIQIDDEVTISFYYFNPKPIIPMSADDCSVWTGSGNNNFGFHFTRDSIFQEGRGPLRIEPTVKIEEVLYAKQWEKHEISFTAIDSYYYVAIGNFHNDQSTEVIEFEETIAPESYYLLDEICIVKNGGTCDIVNSEKVDVQNSFNIYPNPFKDFITIQSNFRDIRKYKFSMFDIKGHQIYTHIDLSNIMQTSALDSGIYYYKVYDKNQIIQEGKMLKI